MKRILIFLIITIYAHGADFGGVNFSIISSEKEGSVYKTVLNDNSGIEINITSPANLSVKQQGIIANSYNTFFNWKEMKIASAHYIFEDTGLSIVLSIESLVYKNTNLNKYMPSGIQLYYNNFFEYDFRMFKDSLFMRLKGQYFSKTEFLDEIFNAAKDPLLYVQVHDPSYLIRQIDEIKAHNNKQDKDQFELLEKTNSLLEQYLDLDNRHNDLLQSHEALTENYNKLLEDLLALTEKNELLTGEKESLSAQQEKLINGVLSLNNRNFFGSLEIYDANAVKEIITIKTSNPEFTVKDTETALKEKGVKVATKTIEAVFIIYFAEFPQNK